jgi:hypothetical protein
MDALEQLSQYRDVEPASDSVVAAALDTITAAFPSNAARTRRKMSPSIRRRPRLGRRSAIAAAGALAVIAAGCGIAAAAGPFDPPQPSPAATSFMSSPDPAKVPGAKVQLSVPGPEGTTFQVVSDTVTTPNQTAACVALGIIGSHGEPLADHPGGGCADVIAAPGGTVPPRLAQLTPSIQLQVWHSPSGASYYVIFGQGIPGVAEVSLTNSGGAAATTQPAVPGGYAIYIPATRLVDYDHLIFTNTSGTILFSQNLNR